MNNDTQSDAGSLRSRAEELLQKKIQKPGAQLTESDLLKLIFELEVHQIELELQNEELILAKERAEAAAEKYTQLYNFSTSGYFTLSREEIILDLNHAATLMLGKNRSQLIDRRFLLYVADNSKPVFQLFLEKVFGSIAKERCELNLLKADNSQIFVFIDAIASKDGSQCFLKATVGTHAISFE